MKRITIILGALAALMLVPAASAFAETAHVKLNIVGSGSGEVKSEANSSLWGPGTPPIACSYNGSVQSGVCANTPSVNQEEAGYYGSRLKAFPAAGSEIASWTVNKGEDWGECPGLSGPTTCIVFNEAEEEGDEWEITATFVKFAGPPLIVNIEEGSGTVVSNPAGIECKGAAPKSCETGKITEGTKVTLTASPASGYAFKSWKGCDSGGVNGRQCTVTLSSAKTVGAKFYKVWNLSASKSSATGGTFSTSPGGVNCGSGCISSSANYKEGALTLKAKPAKNFHFVEFKNGTGPAASCNGVTTETCSIATFNADSSIQEVYAENAKKQLEVRKVGGGQGFVKTKPTNINCGYTCSTVTAEFFAAEEVPVTVTLNKGTTQVTWESSAGTCTGHALTCAVPMSSSNELKAKFE